MRGRRYRIAALLLAAVTMAGTLVASAGGDAAGERQLALQGGAEEAAQAVVAQALPGAVATLTPDAVAKAGYQLSISAPDAAITQPGSDDPAFAAAVPAKGNEDLDRWAELGWRAKLAAGLAATRDGEIVSYSVSPGAATPPSGLAGNYLSGVLRFAVNDAMGVAAPRLGTVKVADATRQAQSNLVALAGLLPANALEATRIVTVPVDANDGLFALEVQLRVRDLVALEQHFGDIVEGLQSGLVGNSEAVIEGLAINVVDSAGRRIGSWQTVRASTGDVVWDPVLSWPSSLQATKAFPNLTGGPPTLSATTGSAGTVSPAHRRCKHRPGRRHHKRRHHRRPRRHAQRRGVPGVPSPAYPNG